MPCKVIYELHAEFNSMMQVSQAEEVPDDDDQEIGIPIRSFMEQSTLFGELHSDIADKFLSAVGITTQNKKAKVKWSQYL